LISTVSVSQASAISVTALPLDIACSSSNIGAVNLSLSGGTGTYSFQWSNGATSQNISGLSAGNYAVTITDANNCQSFVSATVSSTPGLQLIATGTNISCNGGNNGCVEVLVNGGTAPYSYLWSNGSTVDSVCGLAPGTYIVTVTDNGGGGLQNDTIYQEGFQATHNWTLNVPTGTNGADNNFWTVSDAEAGVLPNGCGTSGNGDRTLHITSVFNPTGGAAYDAGGLCGLLFCPQTNMRAESPSFSTIGFTNLSLSFDFISQGDGLIDNASVLYNDGSGWNVLANSIKSGCCGGPCSGFNQGQWTAFNVALPASCNNNPNVRVAVNWTNNDDGVGTDPSVAINNVLVYRTNSGGTACSGTDTITITQPAALVSNTVSITNANCSTPGAINITVSGGTTPYSFVWSNGASTEDVSGLAAGSYSVTITDANGCSVVNTANTVNSSGQPQPSVNNSVNPSCNNSNDGSVSLTITNGTAPYSFIWNSGQTTQNLSGLGGGNYSVTVSDALGCTASISVSLTEPSAIQATITTVPADCNNSNASIDVLASGGAGAPYSFVWQNAATSQNLIGLSSGNYAVTIEDANGCTIVENITIATPLIPQLSAFIGQSGIVDSSIVLGESIEVNAGNNQSSQGVVYQWTALPGSANLVNDTSFATNVSPDPAGFYTMIITATSADGCTSTDTLTLTVNPASDPKIPNAFSPNNDGTNDIFRVVDLDVQYLKEFKVYNRWGQLLYDNLQGSWDGTFNGTEQPRDTYLYIISWQLPSDPNPVLNRGTVTLLR
jgi:gliding motility-associated-like protein